MSLLLPSFLQRLADPAIRNVLLCGCGGGFDFVHGLVLYPELQRLGKKVVIGSYSFGNPAHIKDAEVVFNEDGVLVKSVNAASVPPSDYGPEVHLCSFLDDRFPGEAPHCIYAYYARAFSVPMLSRLYRRWIDEHAIDAIVLIDGGSDSLMVGDESGLGDPIEDAVSVATVASIEGLKARILLSIGLGSDRFNDVSDAASLRAIAELTRAGGFLGAVSLEPASPGIELYRAGLKHIYEQQTFRSVLAGNIVAAASGLFGDRHVPEGLGRRVREGGVYLWPLMAMLWAFDVEKVAERSLIVRWIRDCASPIECQRALLSGRMELGDGLRGVEDLPRHEEKRHP